MADIPGGSKSYFSDVTYQEYLKNKSTIRNERLRNEDETIFDAALSEEADFTKYPEGKEILGAIRSYK